MFALQRSVADNCLRGKAAEEKVRWRRKERKKFDTSCTRLRSYLDHNRFLLIRNGLGDRCIYHCGSCLACLFLMHRLYYLPRSRDNIILAYISGVMVGVLYMSQYIKIFFYRWVLVVYWDAFRVNAFCDVFPGEICFVSVHHHNGQINPG